jgi:hypothetical protein
MAQFVQLSKADCSYLLELIKDMDSDTKYTERQRSYTVPKLQKISLDPRSARLAYQDVDYLLDLIEDDDLPETEQQREMARTQILEIQSLQNARFDETRDIESQRESRRMKRLSKDSSLGSLDSLEDKLKDHFERPVHKA